jgi:hypothetical protein
MLDTPFSEVEVAKSINGMKLESAPGPNGFSVTFFRKLWGLVKGEIMKMVQDFHKADLDLGRLNYRVITLVPKNKEVNTIRPICLLNVDFKIFPKLLMDRITHVASSLINESQTTFVKGRNILEGVVILHELIHELKRSKKQGVLFKIDFEKAYDKVRWNFVEEVMREKGLPSTWIRQTMSTFRGGRVCVNVNGERSQYFKTYQGLRQGDPLSPLLFNLVAKVLDTLMRKAVGQGKLKGVVSHLIPEGITHIQYTDDTILMAEGDDSSIVQLKFILYCFEWLSGLKINYHKSEAYIFEKREDEEVRIVKVLNCRLGMLPMTYLGIPISDCKMGKVALWGVSEKVAKRIPPWKGKFMSSGGRLILTNSSLSSLPIYTMGFYLLPLGIHRRMDQSRARFFWRGASNNFKFHMVSWPAVCRPKQFGGLGIINTEILNRCIITKWI